MPIDQSLVNRLCRLREIWLQYTDARRRFLIIAERCCLRGWPDRKLELRNAFRLQGLFCDMELLRLDHLISNGAFDGMIARNSLITLDAIASIIHKQWTHVEEATLRQDHSDYPSVRRQIEECATAVDPTANSGPYRDAQRDPEYVSARQAVADAVTACDKQLTFELG
jgi:hypothetical protein